MKWDKPYQNTSLLGIYCRNIAATVSGNIAATLQQYWISHANSFCQNSGNITAILAILPETVYTHMHVCIDGIKFIFKIHILLL